MFNRTKRKPTRSSSTPRSDNDHATPVTYLGGGYVDASYTAATAPSCDTSFTSGDCASL
ncbi:hypothetical protein [Nocardia colli]|uniref:hypothetical protein n=1 Tax=Nocardia colli TaxID=2545717 RepID=UPI0035DFCA17